jgi:hypothetical protein
MDAYSGVTPCANTLTVVNPESLASAKTVSTYRRPVIGDPLGCVHGTGSAGSHEAASTTSQRLKPTAAR